MRPKKILVIDDDPNMLKLASATLQAAGYEVHSASDGEQGLKKARAEQPDLLIVDLILPELDGWRVCQQLKLDERFRQTPMLMLSSLVQDEVGKKPIELGDAYLAKPFAGAQLLAKVKELLHEP